MDEVTADRRLEDPALVARVVGFERDLGGVLTEVNACDVVDLAEDRVGLVRDEGIF